MHFLDLIGPLFLLSFFGYHLGRRRALSLGGGRSLTLHSRPPYYGFFVALWGVTPALLVIALWMSLESSVLTRWVVSELPESLRTLPPAQLGLVVSDMHNMAFGSSPRVGDPAVVAAADRLVSLRQNGLHVLQLVTAVLSLSGMAYAYSRISPSFRARNRVERAQMVVMIACSTVAVLTTIGIVLSLTFESIRFFEAVPVTDFLFGTEWSPQTAMRSDQVGSSGSFGAVPLFLGTLLVSLISMVVAVPVGLFSAIYMSEYASQRFRSAVKPALEILAGIPTVVYGFFAALVVAPFFHDAGAMFGISISPTSAMAAGAVMGVMIVPFISSLSDDVITAVPQSMRDGSLALGATKSETVRLVLLPAALPGIVGGILLAASRAIGETMIVVMAAGMTANLTANPFASVTTVT
ncbi:MAG: phosphate ABC transporter permease subunit PstC, partial [Alphaproteobacteria bacterium]|nr:phosphate ABC transporter permease subunit PstC [Alphaproteobacteria bacterium]